MEQNNIDLNEEVHKLTNLTTRYIRKFCCKDSKTELTRTQSVILMYIYEHQQNGEKVYQKDIEEHFMIRRSTATEILKKLETTNYIIRKNSILDGRLKDLILTEKALTSLSESIKKINDFKEILERNITLEEKKLIYKIISKMKKNILQELNNEKNSKKL